MAIPSVVGRPIASLLQQIPRCALSRIFHDYTQYTPMENVFVICTTTISTIFSSVLDSYMHVLLQPLSPLKKKVVIYDYLVNLCSR